MKRKLKPLLKPEKTSNKVESDTQINQSKQIPYRNSYQTAIRKQGLKKL